MGFRRGARGFTLIELLSVVVIIGVLATVATVAYRRYVRASHVEEAQDVIIGIRSAEEAFFAENGVYLDVSGSLGTNCKYPSQSPGAFKTAWGGPCSCCTNSNSWTALTFAPSAPVFYGYSVVADAAVAPAGRGINLSGVSNAGPDVTGLGAGGKPWYFVEADANISGDGVNFTHVYGMSGLTELIVDGAGN
jgi:prepilin-type N-terminal cleavage/methylation domain-containing protein